MSQNRFQAKLVERTYSRKWGKLLTFFSILILLEQNIGRLLQEAEKGCGVSGL